MNKTTAVLGSALKPFTLLTAASTMLLLSGCFSTDLNFAYDRDGIDNNPSSPVGAFSVKSTDLEKTAAQTYTHTFTSSRAGTVSYADGCALAGGDTDEVVAGSNSKTINTTNNDYYQNCSFTVSDETSNAFDELSVAYIKLDSVSGNPLTDQALSQVWGEDGVKWGCVEDLNTGLIWEVKETDDGLRDKDWTYTWYSTVNNGGNAGTPDGGTCYAGATCDTSGYANNVNALAMQLCGSPADWRVPSIAELRGLLNAPTGSAGHFINLNLFPNNRLWYWSSSPNADNSHYAWFVYFSYGYEYNNDKGSSNYVRLVRSGQ